MRGVGGLNCISWSPDGQRIVAGGQRPHCQCGHCERAEQLILAEHAAPVTDVSWSPDGNQIASSSDDGSIKIWDGKSGQEQRKLKAPAKLPVFRGVRIAIELPEHSIVDTMVELVLLWESGTQPMVKSF